jgi:hypothetical protein
MEAIHVLHALILRQQRLIEQQIALLNDGGMEEHTPHDSNVPWSAAPSSEYTFKLIKQRLECWMVGEPPPPSLLVIGEKESPSSMFLKYSQQLLKWAELELVVIREYQRIHASEGAEDTPPPPTPEELEIVHHFLNETRSFPEL